MIAAIKAGYAIHVDQFIHALMVIAQGMFAGRPYDTQTFQVNTLDQVGALDIETSDKPNISHDAPLTGCLAKPRGAISIRHSPNTTDVASGTDQ